MGKKLIINDADFSEYAISITRYETTDSSLYDYNGNSVLCTDTITTSSGVYFTAQGYRAGNIPNYAITNYIDVSDYETFEWYGLSPTDKQLVAVAIVLFFDENKKVLSTAKSIFTVNNENDGLSGEQYVLIEDLPITYLRGQIPSGAKYVGCSTRTGSDVTFLFRMIKEVIE